jgi:hypothetical protein
MVSLSTTYQVILPVFKTIKLQSDKDIYFAGRTICGTSFLLSC